MVDDCLAIHNKASWDALSDKVGALRHQSAPAASSARSLAGQPKPRWIARVESLPAYLRELVGLGNEAVIVGSRDHAEIWAPERWDSYRRALDDPEELARAFEGLGI